ncbi:MAG: DUF3489 domain-containing protein [Rhodomicrobium sp.]
MAAGSKHPGDPAPRERSKLAAVVGMLRRSEGATIGDLTAATGWLPHTTRAAITGLRNRGYSVVRERMEHGSSAYRISDAPVGGSDTRAPKTAENARQNVSVVRLPNPAPTNLGKDARIRSIERHIGT